MFDLGEYANNILWSYATTIALLGGFLYFSIRKHKKVSSELKKMNEEEHQS